MEPRISIITLGVQNMPVSIRFYRDGLGFPTDADDDAEWAIFQTTGTRFALYPRENLAADIGTAGEGAGFAGVTLAHNVSNRDDVDRLINQAVDNGADLLKSPCEADWGGYSGYFADPDGYPWEIAWAEAWKFDENGTLWGGPLGSRPATDSSGSDVVQCDHSIPRSDPVEAPNPPPTTTAEWGKEMREVLAAAHATVGQEMADGDKSEMQDLYTFAPGLAAHQRGIADEETIRLMNDFVDERMQHSFELDPETTEYYELNFALSYLDAHVAVGLISEHREHEIMEYLCEYDVIEI